MEIKHNLTIEWSRDYLIARKNISLVIEYLEKLKELPPKVEVNNDSIRLLMESLKVANDMYQDLNKLPIYNSELRAENHVLRVENKRLIEENKRLIQRP